MKYLVIESATRKVTPFNNIRDMFLAYPQLNVTQDAYIASATSLSSGQDIEAVLAEILPNAPVVAITTQDYKDKLTSHNTSNEAGDTTIVCTASIPTDTPARGLIKVSNGTLTYNLRYSSYATATFTLQNKSVTATTGGTGGTVLKIATGNFLDGTVCVGDIVYNSTDGSYATIVSIDSDKQLTTTALAGGTDNTYTSGDAIKINVLPATINNTYYVYSQCYDPIYRGLYLAPTEIHATKIALAENMPKDTPQVSYCIIYDASAGTYKRYRYSKAIGKEITLTTLTGACATGGNATTLIDSDANFTTTNVKVGDIVKNLTDGSYAAVVSVDSTTQLTTGTLSGGANNAWGEDDEYVVQVGSVAFTADDFVILPNWKLTPTGLQIIKLN